MSYFLKKNKKTQASIQSLFWSVRVFSTLVTDVRPCASSVTAGSLNMFVCVTLILEIQAWLKAVLDATRHWSFEWHLQQVLDL